ncbi:LOW QUALITY PROTEIN: hypothetical protein TorRG33x02_073100 [Trema orientale]|uniref:Uncharacterized protein n=1 Tax=Trema orientale TaxID=63057 RepID=A0A2P5FGL2_TREOI|nr:LOW QUALITY PROTEIN: hypothetical protein TorRG33x02_073100 [Trema orientale]
MKSLGVTNGVDEEEIGKNIEDEQQMEFIAEDIAEMEEEAIFDTSPMFSTADMEKMFGGATDVDKAVEIATSCLMVGVYVTWSHKSYD